MLENVRIITCLRTSVLKNAPTVPLCQRCQIMATMRLTPPASTGMANVSSRRKRGTGGNRLPLHSRGVRHYELFIHVCNSDWRNVGEPATAADSGMTVLQ